MVEILAVPGFKVVETPLSAWVDQFARQGLVAAVTRESSGVSWIEVHALRLRGYAVMEDGRYVEAINFELHAPDPAPARDALYRAAEALSWDLDEDDEDDEDDSDDD